MDNLSTGARISKVHLTGRRRRGEIWRMRQLEQWLGDYAVTHRNPTNQTIHTICVPAIYWSITAVVWPGLFIPVIFFYGWLGLKAGVVMAVFTALCVGLNAWAAPSLQPYWALALAVFVLAWIGQFYGHKIEGKKPAFLDDLVFLLIGPLWTARKLRIL
jgi:uncharacterized membrane protein YGL010W